MKGHRTDGVSLTFSVIFLGIAAWWLAAQVIHLELPAVGWIVASALILFGMFGLLGALRSGRSAARTADATTSSDVTPTTGTPADPMSGPGPVSGTPVTPAEGFPVGSPVEPVTAPPHGRAGEGPA
ncbi:hypothetical protein [Micromonospora sp. NPDC049679]|uniref:hypothetical protein n=1 Tax=Micromonospora sp. NPDC049679 TaxID=3155920 RepID=UPI0033E04768